MANYKIEIKKSAAKEISKLPKVALKRIVERIGALGEEPRPKGCKKLSADEKYRIRVGVYKVLYSIDDDRLIIFVVKAGHRKEIYKSK
jgi:mRNA interferase RelE/StbE